MKNILFPTDFSEQSHNALLYALQIAQKTNARILTLHVFFKPDITGAGHLPQTMEQFYESIDLYELEIYRNELPALKKIAQSVGLDQIEMQHLLKEGNPQETIVEIAKAENADLIVMGTSGAHGLKAIFWGSIAGEVMESAPCPVLAIPAKAAFDGKIDNIVFTTSYSEEEITALHRVSAFAASFEAAIHCVNVDLAHIEQITGHMQQFKGATADLANIQYQVLDGIDIREEISKYALQNKADIIAMVTHRRNFLEELFHYSKTKDMAYHSHTPVFAIPASTL